MRRTTEILTCDICGAETEKSEEQEVLLYSVRCPTRQYRNDGGYEKAESLVDMCPDCYNAYFALFDQHFATIKKTPYGNIVVTKKFKTEDPFTTEEPEEFNNAPNT